LNEQDKVGRLLPLFYRAELDYWLQDEGKIKKKKKKMTLVFSFFLFTELDPPYG
jgi:hypothetical protein